MTDKPIIRIGPTGWLYKDWEGVVDAQKPSAKFHPLEYLARYFNTIEINSSFYRSFTAATVRRERQLCKIRLPGKPRPIWVRAQSKPGADGMKSPLRQSFCQSFYSVLDLSGVHSRVTENQPAAWQHIGTVRRHGRGLHAVTCRFF